MLQTGTISKKTSGAEAIPPIRPQTLRAIIWHCHIFLAAKKTRPMTAIFFYNKNQWIILIKVLASLLLCQIYEANCQPFLTATARIKSGRQPA